MYFAKDPEGTLCVVVILVFVQLIQEAFSVTAPQTDLANPACATFCPEYQPRQLMIAKHIERRGF